MSREGGDIVNEKLKFLVEQDYPRIVNDRRYFHSHPEIGREEINTSKYVQQELEKEGIECHRVAETGIVGFIRGEKPGKTILIRADMDALPLCEETNLSFASKVQGKMHACGHDVHTANLLGLSRILNQMKDEICGNVKLCFQPAEEGLGGAAEMVKGGVLEDPPVDYAIGMHIDPSIEIGACALEDGPITSYTQFFSITFCGRGGHGSAPFRSVDPIRPAMTAYEAMNSLTKEVNPLHLNVIQICSIQGGFAPAVIPDECTIKGTVRTHYEEDNNHMKTRIYEIARQVGNLFGVGVKIDYWGDGEPVWNDPVYSEKARRSIADIFDKGMVSSVDFKMVGEDFSLYSKRVPASFLLVGCSDGTQETSYSLHNAHFNPDERVLKYGALALGQIALDFLKETPFV